MNPDQLAELEDERRFLLRSLRDLDAERDAGDVDAVDYETLRDDYTKRAADVLRAIEDGKAALHPRRPRRWARTAALLGAVAVLAVGAGVVVARSSGERTAGDQITGGLGREDTAALLARARAALRQGDAVAAQELYGRVIEEDPQNPEALAYSGWLLVLASSGASEELRATALASAKDQLRAAVAADPAYPDPHCFLGVIAAEIDDDAATARAEAEQCVAQDPPAQIRALVEQYLAPTSPSSPPSPSPPPSTAG